jgi:hypothetical protein
MADEDQIQPGGGAGAPGPDPGAGQPSEEELRAQLEEEIRKVRVEDVVLQGAVSILNLAARRIAKEDERDLEQARIGIEAARALTDLVPEQAQPQLRQAVSELQLMYAKHAGEGDAPETPADPAAPGPAPGPGPEQPSAPKPEGSSGLWTPHERD